MTDLIATLALFTVFHMLPALGPVRRALVGALGKAPYIVGYSLMSLGLLGWVAVVYVEAPYIELWAPAAWARWVPVVAMVPVCLLLVGTFVHPNPLSVGVRGDRFDATKPGIVSVTRHPLMWALALWALAHIAPNGDAASVVMFGFFAVMGLLGPFSLDRKAKRALGADRWAELTGPTANIPFAAQLAGRARVDWPRVLCQPALGGMVLYAVLMALHPFVIGLSPLP